MLAHLYRYRIDFVAKVVDNVIESISLGLERNDFNYNQRRIAEVKYLAEMYNYRLVEHAVIFDVMYKIMTFGHGGPPVPGRMNPFDLADDFFRIRLIYFILDASGMYFNKGAAGKKLDYFLSFFQVCDGLLAPLPFNPHTTQIIPPFPPIRRTQLTLFQYYIYTKNPLPMDIEFLVHDIYKDTRPQWKLASNFEEASKAFQLVLAQDRKAAGLEEPEPEDQDDEPSGPSTEDELGDADADDDVDDSGASDDGEGAEDDVDDDAQQSSSEESDDEAIIVTRQEEEFDPEWDADFEREYAKMMSESLESRKLERRPVFDVALPVRPRAREPVASNEQGDGEAEASAPAPAPKMAFSVLTKKGNKQQVSLEHFVLPRF